MEPAYDDARFKELLLYIADKLADDRSFGATKLNKVLFFSDFLAYGLFGEPITGATYQRLEFGPAPKELLSAQAELEQSGDAILVTRRHFNLTQKRLMALRPADVSWFSAKQVALVDDVIEMLRHRSARDVSAFSHDVALGWQIAGDQEQIPYAAVFLSVEPLTSTDIEHGRRFAGDYGFMGI